LNIDEQIAILEAYRNGKRILMKMSQGTNTTFTIGERVHHSFNFGSCPYEIVKSGEDRLIEDLEAALNKGAVLGSIELIVNDIKEGKYRDE